MRTRQRLGRWRCLRLCGGQQGPGPGCPVQSSQAVPQAGQLWDVEANSLAMICELLQSMRRTLAVTHLWSHEHIREDKSQYCPGEGQGNWQPDSSVGWPASDRAAAWPLPCCPCKHRSEGRVLLAGLRLRFRK